MGFFHSLAFQFRGISILRVHTAFLFRGRQILRVPEKLMELSLTEPIEVASWVTG